MDTSTPTISSYRLSSLEEVFLQFPVIDISEALKLDELRADIGDKLFSQLSDEDKKFIIETEGIVDLGYEASEKDLNRIFKHIEE